MTDPNHWLSCAPHIGRFENATPGYGWTMPWAYNERRGPWCWRYTVPMFDFRLDPVHPLQYREPDGGLWQPDRHSYRTDVGTIPPPFSWLPNYHPLMYPRAYAGFHDSAASVTIDDPAHPGTAQHGLWYCGPDETLFHFRRLTCEQANRLCLVDMLQVEGATLRQANSECWAVDRFGKRW